MLLQLVYVMCTLNNSCIKQEIRYDETVSMMQCMMDSMIQPAKWASEHPGYFCKVTRCGPLREDT